ncbi:MbnP family protein [uncultured Algibacter sp.]|uniref:MbnP family protein n=1 Tax=uncultured Algibacter sp. TaxID=298659 RepID=UPI002639A9C1|nr:MbnP family protein [uncultured Algibacter sp.]
MNKVASIFLFVFITLVSCHKDNDDNVSNVNISLHFTHNWDGIPVSNSDFNALKFTNENGEMLSIERLRYLISDITLTNSTGESLTIDAYNLVDVTNNGNLEFSPEVLIPTDAYTNISFTFGFTNEKNIDAAYQDLNSASWFVPAMLGGGYHYIQFDGKFLNSSNIEQGFNYHAIRAVDNPGANPTFPQDTFITVNLGAVTITSNIVFNIEMNIAEWFKTPNIWDLNVFNQSLMPNSTAQIMMFENGQNVFSLKSTK